METSTLSAYDYAHIVGKYNAIRTGKTVDPRLLERGYTEEQIKLMHQKLGEKINAVQSLNIKFVRPLEDFDYPLFGYVMTLYRAYKDHGILPFPGPITEQPAQLMEILNTIESVDMEYKQRDIDEQQRRAKREQRKVSGSR